MDSLGYLSQLETTTVICFEGSPIVRAITNRIWYLHFLHVSAASPREITALLIYFLSVNHESIPEWIMMSGEKHLEKCTTKSCTAVVTKLSHLAKHKYTNTQTHKYTNTQIHKHTNTNTNLCLVNPSSGQEPPWWFRNKKPKIRKFLREVLLPVFVKVFFID